MPSTKQTTVLFFLETRDGTANVFSARAAAVASHLCPQRVATVVYVHGFAGLFLLPG